VVVDHHDHVQGFADDPGIEHGPTHAAADDSGYGWDGDQTTDTTDDQDPTWDDTDGASWGGDAGGDDFGGGDLGSDDW
jgi:hypothetical protein